MGGVLGTGLGFEGDRFGAPPIEIGPCSHGCHMGLCALTEQVRGARGPQRRDLPCGGPRGLPRHLAFKPRHKRVIRKNGKVQLFLAEARGIGACLAFCSGKS